MKVLNFGSLNIDYVYSVSHFVRAGETLSSEKRELFCGGKGLNQSVAFARAGAEVYHAGNVGADGTMLLDMLKDSGADTRFVQKSDLPTGHAIIQVSADGENCILLFDGANASVSDTQIEKTFEFFQKGDLLVLQNEINAIDRLLVAAKNKGMITVLNPSPFNEKITALDFSKIDWLIINETEGRGISGKDGADEIIDELLSRYPDMKIVLTLGKRGAIYADAKNMCAQGIIDAPVVDTTGAGDTFTGYFFTSIFSGKTPKQALLIASCASSIAISRKGAAPSIPTMSEVLEKLSKL